MSDTPRTDAAERMAFNHEYMVPTDFARQLEREVYHARMQRDGWADECETNMALLKLALEAGDQAIRQRDTLANDLQRILIESSKRMAEGGDKMDYQDTNRQTGDIARAALAAVKGGQNG